MKTTASYMRIFCCLAVLLFVASVSTEMFAASAKAEAPKAAAIAKSGVIKTEAMPAIRVTKPVDDTKRSAIYGHTPKGLRHATKLGRVAPNTPAQHLILMLKSSPEQEREARKVIDEQQDKRTANYHQWATPEQFGQHFGVHDNDIAKVTAWMQSHGLKVENVAKSKRAIQFSGTSGQLEKAFQMEMHYYLMPNGETHVSNDRDISVPQALRPVISGVPTLNDFFKKGHHTPPAKLSKLKPGPKYTDGSGNNFVGPADFATIYNTAPLLANGINGTGVTIGIAARSDILLSDVQTYRQMFNLPVNDPNFINTGDDAGVVIGDDSETDLDTEISGGVAPNATVDVVIGTNNWLVDGITLSEMYLVESNIADIISISYSTCESSEGAGGNSFNNQLFEQAAAQGISVFVAAGDSGSAECDGDQPFETGGYATNGESSTWYSVAVGGTEFNETGGSYWTTNNGTTKQSATSYIPELPWNEAGGSDEDFANYSGLTAAEQDCVYASLGYWVQDDCMEGLWAGAGGPSAYYLQPPWQTGSGVPNTDPTLPGGNWINLNLTNTNANGASGAGYTAVPTVTLAGETCTIAPSSSSTQNDGSIAIVNVALGDDVTSADNGSVTAIGVNQYAATLNSKGTAVTGFEYGQGWNCTAAGTATFTAAPAGGTTATASATLGQMYNMTPLVTGVPHRYTPDISLNAAAEHDGTVYCDEGACVINSDGSIGEADIVGGTSVAAPSMAGIQALINQANGGRQGMPGYIYYALANAQYTASPTACNSSSISSANCPFQDITAGDNLVCGTVSTNQFGTATPFAATCTASTPANKMGFTSAQGYDMATGLGSVNAANLSSQWSSVHFNSSSTTLGLSSTNFNFGTNVTLTGTVAGSGTPTGDVAFIVTQGVIGDTYNTETGALNGSVAFATLSGGSYSAVLNNLPGGTYYVTARYAGDENFASSLSTPVQVTVGQDSGTTLTVVPRYLPQGDVPCYNDFFSPTLPPIPASLSVEYPAQIWFDVQVAGASGAGAPTGTVQLFDAGNPIATLTLDPNGYAYGLEGESPDYYYNNCLEYQVELANIPVFNAGAHTITATYSGDNTFPATSTTVSPSPINVIANADKTALTISPTTDILAGQAVQLTAAISGDTSTAVGAPGGHSSFNLTAAANAAACPVTAIAPYGLCTTYTGTFTGATTGSLVGYSFEISGFNNGYDNGAFTVTANTGTTSITVANPGGIAQTGSGATAVFYAGNGNFNGNATGILAVAQNIAPVGTITFTDTTNANTVLCSAVPVVSGAVTYTASHQTYYYPTASCSTTGITGATGSHTISAAFASGNGNYASTSGTKGVTILAASAAASTSIAVSSNSNPSVLYPPPSLTATVTGAPGGSTPSGTVTFFDGTTILGTASLSSGAATLSTAYSSGGSGLGVSRTFGGGTHSITATFAGSGTSTGTALALTSAAATLDNVTTVYTGNIPGGAACVAGVTYYTVAGFTATADNGQFTCASIAPGNPGTITLNNGVGVASTPTGGTTTLTLTAAAAAVGSNTTYTGTITGGGTSCFGNVGVPITVAGFATAANNGTFNCVSSTTTTITVANAAGVAQSMVSTITAAAAATGSPKTTTYTGTIPGGATAGQYTGASFTVAGFSTRSPNDSADNGTFTYASSTATTLTLNNTAGIAATGATATATPNNVTAKYSATATGTYGGGTFVGSTSPVFSQVVNLGATENLISAKTVGGYGQNWTFTSQIPTCGAAFSSLGPPPVCPLANILPYGPSDTGINQSAGGAVIGAAYIDYIPYGITGSVQFFLDGNSIGYAPLTAQAAYPDGGSQIYMASLTTETVPAGSHTLTSTYASDGNFATANSNSQSITVGSTGTSIAVTSVSPAAEDYGSTVPVTVTATVSWTGTGAAPTAADVSIGQVGLSGSLGSPSCAAPVGTTMACSASYTGGTDLPGSYTFTAAFSGDGNYSSSASSQSNNFTINSATSSTSVSTSGSPSIFGASVTFTATISGENGLVRGGAKANNKKPNLVTGNVAWSANTGCGTTAVTSGTPGTATCTTSSLPVGSDVITATYSGDSNHGGSSGTLSPNQQVNGAPTAISVTSVTPSSEDYGSVVPVAITAQLTWTGALTPPTANSTTVSFGGAGLGGTFGAASCGAPSGDTINCSGTYTPSGLDAANSYSITAAFSGDSNYNASGSAQTNNFIINAASSTTSVGTSGSPSTYGQSVTFTATITGENSQVKGGAKANNKKKPLVVTGSVTWSANTGCGTTAVTSGYPGTATCTTTTLAAGSDVITASYSGDSNHGVSSGTLSPNQQVNQASQTITFTLNAPSTAADQSSFNVAATGGGSGNAVTFTAAGVCSVTGGGSNTAQYTMNAGSGTCSVIANQAGNSNYLAASQVTESVNAGQLGQTITFTTNAPSSATYNTSFSVAATGGASGNAVTFTAAGVCGITAGGSNSATYTMNSGTGTCSVIANQAGNGNYTAAPTVTKTVNATLASQTITFTTPAPPAAEFLGTFTVAATGGASGNPVAFSVGAGSVCTLSSATYTMTAKVGNCYVVANQTGNSNYAAATQVTETVVAKAGPPVRIAPTVTFTGAPTSAPYLSSFSGLMTTQNNGVTPTFSVTTASACSISGSTVTMKTGNLSCTVKASWAETTYYSAATLTQTVSATPLSTTTTITGTAPKTNPLKVTVSFAVNDGSPLTGSTLVTVTSAAGPSCSGTLTAGSCTLTFSAPVTTSLTASFPGTTDYTGSTSASYPLTVN